MPEQVGFDIGFKIPGEGLAIAIANAYSVYRHTMSQENRDRGDKIWLDIVERVISDIDKAGQALASIGKPPQS